MNDAHIKKEKQKARDLRHSRWWQEKLQNPQCYYCHLKIAPDSVTMDHVIPLSKGGTSAKNNIVVSCKTCNNLKKNHLPF